MARKSNIRWMLGFNLAALSAVSAVMLVGALPMLGTNVSSQTHGPRSLQRPFATSELPPAGFLRRFAG